MQSLGGQEVGEAKWCQVSTFLLHQSFCLESLHGAQRFSDFSPSEGTWIPSLLCSPVELTNNPCSWCWELGALLTANVEGKWGMPSPVPSSGGGSEPGRPLRLLSTWRNLTRAWEAVKEGFLEEGVQIVPIGVS